MERMEEYAEEESPFAKPENLPKDPIQEDLTTNSSELLHEMESVKRKNERILRAQEELNQILTKRFQTEGKGKRVGL